MDTWGCRFIVFSLILLQGCASQAEAQVPPDRAEAAKILTFMGYTNVVIAAIVQSASDSPSLSGPMSSASPSHCGVIGSAFKDGQRAPFAATLYFDKTEGCFYFQFDKASGGINMWTKNGYKLIVSKK